MRPNRVPFVLVAFAACAVAVALAASPSGAPSKGSGPSGTAPATPASLLTAMDRTADPCQDFYKYACGGWIGSTKLPADQSRWGRGFTEIAERNRETLREILEAAAKGGGGDAKDAKLGAYYGSCMDEAAIDKAGSAPLKPLLAEIAGVKDAKSLMEVAGKLHPLGVPVLFGAGWSPTSRTPISTSPTSARGGWGSPTGTTI